MSAEEEALVGKSLGPCRIVRRVAKGGMGIIYEGRHVALDKRVAVKVLDPLFSSDTSFVERFVREARASARLDHPNIVQVLDVGGDQGLYYIVMQFVDGVALDQIAERAGKMAAEPATKLVREIARGLDAAHRQGVIHRDVKPANVLVQRDGTVKIADFGLARFGNAPSLSSTRLTVEGSFMGTPEYVSPEQAKGGNLDGRADLYSLGITYYRLLAGDVPFHAESAVELAYKHIHEPPEPVEKRVPGLDPRIAKLIGSLLMKDPAQRPPDAAAVVRALDEILAKPAPKTARKVLPPPPPMRPKGMPAPPAFMPGRSPTTVPPPPSRAAHRSAVPLGAFVALLGLSAALAAAPALLGPTAGIAEPFRSTEPRWPLRAALLGGSMTAFVAALVVYRRDLGRSGTGGAASLLFFLAVAGIYCASMTTHGEATDSTLLGLAVFLGVYGGILGRLRDAPPWAPWFARGMLGLGLAFLYGFAIRDPSTGTPLLLAGAGAVGLAAIWLITGRDPGAGRPAFGGLLWIGAALLLLLYASVGDAPTEEWTRRVAGRFAGFPRDLLSRGLLIVATLAAAAGGLWSLAAGLAKWRRYYS